MFKRRFSEINRMAFISEPTTLIRVEGKDE